MSANENTSSLSDDDLSAYAILERDLKLGIGLAEARVQRLLGEVFYSRNSAENGLRRIMRKRGLDHVISLLERPDSFHHVQAFGVTRDVLAFWRRSRVRAGLRELPEALRDLKHLLDREHDVKQARQNLQVREPEVRHQSRSRQRTPTRSR